MFLLPSEFLWYTCLICSKESQRWKFIKYISWIFYNNLLQNTNSRLTWLFMYSLCSNKPRFIDIKLEPMKIRHQIEIKIIGVLAFHFLKMVGGTNNLLEYFRQENVLLNSMENMHTHKNSKLRAWCLSLISWKW